MTTVFDCLSPSEVVQFAQGAAAAQRASQMNALMQSTADDDDPMPPLIHDPPGPVPVPSSAAAAAPSPTPAAADALSPLPIAALSIPVQYQSNAEDERILRNYRRREANKARRLLEKQAFEMLSTPAPPQPLSGSASPAAGDDEDNPIVVPEHRAKKARIGIYFKPVDLSPDGFLPYDLSSFDFSPLGERRSKALLFARFMAVKAFVADYEGTKVEPPAEIAALWKNAVCNTRFYASLVDALKCGGMLHHTPHLDCPTRRRVYDSLYSTLFP